MFGCVTIAFHSADCQHAPRMAAFCPSVQVRPPALLQPSPRICASPTAAPLHANRATGCRNPSAATCSTCAANNSIVSSKCVKPCRTWPAGRQSAGIGARASASVGPPGRGAPVGAGQLRHAAQQPCRRTAAQQHVAAASSSQKCTPWRSGRSGFAARRGSSAAMPARRPAQSAIHGHSAQAGAGRGADRGAEIEQRLGEIAPAAPRASGSAPSRVGQLAATSAWRPAMARVHREQPRHHPLDVAVHRHRRHAERDRADRARRCTRRSRAARASPARSRGNPPAATTARAQACRLRARA